MRYLSLFTGIGGFECGIHSVFPDAECVGYVEINPHSRKIMARNFPNAPCLSEDIQTFHYDPEKHGSIDLVVGGPPCQDLSGMRCSGSYMGRFGKPVQDPEKLGLNGPKSRLMYDYLRVLQSVQKANPAVKFVCENVASMRHSDRDKISELLGVQPIMLDARFLTAQSRRRYFWANFPIGAIERDARIRFEDILVPLEEARKHELSDRGKDYMNRRSGREQKTRWERNYHNDTRHEKSHCALYSMNRNVPYTALIDRRADPPLLRRILPVEVERLQGFPDGYTEGVAKCHRMGALGNAVCAAVACHVMENLKLMQ